MNLYKIDGGYETALEGGENVWEMCYSVLKSGAFKNAVLVNMDGKGQSYSDSDLPGTKRVPRIDKLYRKVKSSPFFITATLAEDESVRMRMGFDMDALSYGKTVFKILFTTKEDKPSDDYEMMSRQLTSIWNEAQKYV